MVVRKLVWLHGEVKSPPFSLEARRTAGFLLRALQRGEMPGMPHSRPMPGIGAGCHELRLTDGAKKIAWRIIYRIDQDSIIVADVFAKKTQKTPENVIEASRKRLKSHDKAKEEPR